MTSLQLIAETPRAGGDGHRYLIPTGSELTESMLGQFIRAASEKERGRNYLAATKEVRQVLDNGTVRTGTEILVLIGVDVDGLCEDKLSALSGFLNERLSRIDGLLSSRSIGEARRSITIERDEFNEWLGDPCLQHVPTTSWSDGPKTAAPDHPTLHSRGPTPRFLLKAVPVALLTIATIVGVVWMFMHKKPPVDTARKPTDPGSPIPATLKPRQDLKDLAKRWKCEQSEVVRSLQRARNWDKRHEHQKPDEFLESIVSDNLMLERVENLVSKKPSSDAYLGFIQSSDKIKHLRDLLSDGGDREALQLRHSLFETWEAFEKVKKASLEVSKILESSDTKKILEKKKLKPAGFTYTIVFIGKMSVPAGLGTGFIEPMTPIFDQQDVKIVTLIESFFQYGKDQGLSHALTQAGAMKVFEQDSLADKLKEFANHAEPIEDAGVNEISKLNFRLHKEEIKTCYGLLEKFFSCLNRLVPEKSGNPSVGEDRRHTPSTE